MNMGFKQNNKHIFYSLSLRVWVNLLKGFKMQMNEKVLLKITRVKMT